MVCSEHDFLFVPKQAILQLLLLTQAIEYRIKEATMSRVQELQKQGQSIWLDYIERGMVQSGELQRLVTEGVTGVTSNPTIFQQAISKSEAYRADLQRLVT